MTIAQYLKESEERALKAAISHCNSKSLLIDIRKKLHELKETSLSEYKSMISISTKDVKILDETVFDIETVKDGLIINEAYIIRNQSIRRL